MNLAKLSKVFSGTSTADALLVVGHATAAANGVYTTADNGTTYTHGAYTFKSVSSKWGIYYNGSTLVSEEATATSRPQGGVWSDCNVLEAAALAISSGTVVVALSLVLTGGVSGGCIALADGGIEQIYTIGANEIACIDARQVFPGGGSIYFGGTDGAGIQFSYDIIATA